MQSFQPVFVEIINQTSVNYVYSKQSIQSKFAKHGSCASEQLENFIRNKKIQVTPDTVIKTISDQEFKQICDIQDQDKMREFLQHCTIPEIKIAKQYLPKKYHKYIRKINGNIYMATDNIIPTISKIQCMECSICLNTTQGITCDNAQCMTFTCLQCIVTSSQFFGIQFPCCNYKMKYAELPSEIQDKMKEFFVCYLSKQDLIKHQNHQIDKKIFAKQQISLDFETIVHNIIYNVFPLNQFKVSPQFNEIFTQHILVLPNHEFWKELLQFIKHTLDTHQQTLKKIKPIQSFRKNDALIQYANDEQHYLQMQQTIKQVLCDFFVKQPKKIYTLMNIKHNIRLFQVHHINQPSQIATQRQYIFPCDGTKCNGLIKTINGRCNTCTKLFCNKCMKFIDNYTGKVTIEILTSQHQCNQIDVENATLFMQENKFCPKCQTIINRTSGCAQMFCTNCKTGFDWNSSHIIKEQFLHNPHYFEWKKSQQQYDVTAAQANQQLHQIQDQCADVDDRQILQSIDQVISCFDAKYPKTQSSTNFVTSINKFMAKYPEKPYIDIVMKYKAFYLMNKDFAKFNINVNSDENSYIKYKCKQITQKQYNINLLKTNTQMEIQQQLNEIKYQNDLIFQNAFLELFLNGETKIIESLEDLMNYTNHKIFKLNKIYNYQLVIYDIQNKTIQKL